MQPVVIVPAFDELKDGGTGLGTGNELRLRTFSLEGSEEAFHDGIIITITGSAHAHYTTQIGQAALVRITGVLTAPV
jgi:hypothetical protein